MSTYYSILGIDPRADAATVRAAYKKLAMAYHPDHNPGNPEAEETFKMVNEAYQTLSDPIKRSRYDGLLFPQFTIPVDYDYERPRRNLRRPVPARPYYQVDRQYFRMQALSLLVFVALAGIGFALMSTIHYVVEHRQLQAYRAETKELEHASSLFASGNFDDAFNTVRRLTEESPLEYRLRAMCDSLEHALRDLANVRFDAKEYDKASLLYTTLARNEEPASVETLRRIAMTEYYLGKYEQSLAAMKELHNQYPESPELVYSIALMNLDKIQNINEAMHYFEIGKSLHQRRIQEQYGISFVNFMNPTGVAELYFDVLHGSARCNILLSKFDEAVKDCDDAVKIRPDAADTYRLRALANARRRKMDTVCRDLARARRLGAKDLEALEREFCL
ncbi:MAG: J domain-containing protein [Chryseolinea sp.]